MQFWSFLSAVGLKEKNGSVQNRKKRLTERIMVGRLKKATANN